jgi:hypothetical protein
VFGNSSGAIVGLELTARQVPPFARYVPDVAALRASSVRVVTAVGQSSNEDLPYYRAALAVAEQLTLWSSPCCNTGNPTRCRSASRSRMIKNELVDAIMKGCDYEGGSVRVTARTLLNGSLGG